jgi:hypothetical protein
MKVKNLIKKLIETNFNIDQEVYIELWEDTEDGYKCLKIPIHSVGEDHDSGSMFEIKSMDMENLVITGYIEKAFIRKWEKRKWNPVNIKGERENYFPIKKKIKLTLPKETEI